MRTSLLIVSPLLLIALLASAAEQNSPTNWTTINFGAFSFRAPPGMTNVPVRGIDSLVGRCVSSNIILTFDYGWYSGGSFKEHLDQWKHSPKFKLTDTTIDGHEAEIVSYQVSARYYTESEGKTNVIRVQFPKVGKDSPRTSLSMTTYCQSEADHTIAQRIFESIRFKRN